MKTILKLANSTALIATVFIATVTILLFVSWYQLHTTKPLELTALDDLKIELRSQPNNEQLKKTIRELHLLSRKAHFTSVTFVNNGGILLLIGIIVLLLSLKIIYKYSKTNLDNSKGMTGRPDRSPSRIIFASLTIALAIAGVALSYLSQRELNIRNADKKEDSETILVAEEEIGELWGSFRNGLGVAWNANPVTNWNGTSGQSIKWKTPLSLTGFNSPVVAGNKIFISAADVSQQKIYCYDLETGAELWQYKATDPIQTPLQEISEDTGYASPTLATNGKKVCAVFTNGRCICLDAKGNKLWSISLGNPDIAYGYASSPLIYNNSLIVQYDTDSVGALRTYSLENGSIEWQTPRDCGSSWSSPIIVDDKVILNAVPMVTAYNLSNGELVWESECLGGEVAPGAGYSSGVILAANEYSTLTAIDLAVGTNLWQSYDNLPEVASVVALSNYVYMASSGGTLSCLDIFTGKECWVWEGDNGFYSSPIAAGGYIFATDVRGDTFIFAQGSEQKFIGKCSLGESVVATMVAIENKIIIRTDNYLYCIANE